jgi:tRNA/tmRNA/rRNA uracil-C5-methylase (TrmA/RlmC/RlmD family)
MEAEATHDIAVTGIAAGGEGVGRLEDGRAVFVRGALPGERVQVAVTEERNRFARAQIVEVLEAAPQRMTPPCPQVAAGCGGCDWQHVAPAAQRLLKARIVIDALRRIGRIAEPPEPDPGPELPAEGWRTTVRAVVDDEGRAGFRLRHAHDPLAVGPGGCLVAHPLVDEVLREGLFPPPVREVTVRAGVASEERLVLCTPKVGDSRVPAGVPLVGADELAGGHRAWIHEVVGGRRWRVSAESFFQGRPDGAEALVDAVVAALDGAVRPGATVIDLYSGVGLFAGVLGERTGGRVVAVESNRAAVADARINLADLADSGGARIVRSDVRRWRPSTADVVVADPSRHGLGADVVPRIDATGASALALVSCDPGALGRDAGLLAAAGWELTSVRLVDLFPHTAHVEVVTSWIRPI